MSSKQRQRSEDSLLPDTGSQSWCDSESGFLLLEDCSIFIRNGKQHDGVALIKSEWLDVYDDFDGDEEFPKYCASPENSPDTYGHDENECVGENRCPCGDLILEACLDEGLGVSRQSESSQPTRSVSINEELKLRLNSRPRFDGTMKDLKHLSCCGGGSGGCLDQKNRSDSVLMVGLAYTCQALGHVRIKSMKAMLRDFGVPLYREQNKGSVDKIKITRPECETEYHAHASIVVEFSVPIPVLDNIFSTNHKRSLQNRRRSLRVKVPPSTQLLFAMMSSDWEHLKRRMNDLKHPRKINNKNFRLEANGSLSRDPLSLFPSNLALEELYTRLQSREMCGRGDIEVSSCDRFSNAFFPGLPIDVVVTNIGNFLRSPSLESLRCTCKYLHINLRAVVPGLKLKLYKHQIRSLSWMRRREAIQITERDCMRQGKKCDGFFERGDIHRAVTGGASVLLRLRNEPQKQCRIDQCTGDEYSNNSLLTVSKANQPSSSRVVARGGLLCDDPGLGKTITVLSLVLQTFGLMSKSGTAGTYDEETSDDNIFSCYWKEQITPIFQKQALNKLVAKLRRYHSRSYYFDYPVDVADVPDYYDVIKAPMCFRQVQRSITNNAYEADFGLFVSDVNLIFHNAMIYNSREDEVFTVAQCLQESFIALVEEFKKEQVRSAEKAFANVDKITDSSIAAILERKSRNQIDELLLPSMGTLIVVPGTLLNHWVEQINMHLDFKYCTHKTPVIFEFKSDGPKSKKEMSELHHRCKSLKTHTALVFIDRGGTKPLPDADFLAMFAIVLTTSQRFTHEWKNGSFDSEIRRDVDTPSNNFDLDTSCLPSACSLLKVHWTRLVVDEGHAMGRGKSSSSILFASWISAQRRWCMTGTPTPNTSSRSGLANLLGLMRFLRHDFFSSRLGGDRVWNAYISRSWNDGNLAAFFRLRGLLSVLMVRHTKLDIDELPTPKLRKTFSKMSAQEQQAYNTLVSAVQSNLIITAMNGKTSGLQDSLLHRSQAKHAREALRNIRLTCCGGTRIVPTLTKKHFDETVDWIEAHTADKVRVRMIQNYLSRAETEQVSSCMVCGIQLSTLLVFPCGDLICTECLDSSSRSCPVCEKPFDVDDFQRLQPGFVYEWQWNLKEEVKKNTARRMGTTRASGADDIVQEEGGGVDANPGRVALRPAVERRRTRRPGDGHTCQYDPAAVDGKCTLCLEPHDSCVLASRRRCPVCHRYAEPCPTEESKFHYLVNKLEKLHEWFSERAHISSTFVPCALLGGEAQIPRTRELKVIVFSQFRPSLNMVGHRLLMRFGSGAIAEYWGKFRTQELNKFTKSEDCFCMLLGKDGSEGLDLSFVTHIFFLEEIWDKSVEHQAVARAWRMGATGQVEVETLVAEGSVEEMMIELETAKSIHEEKSREPFAKMNSQEEYQRSKVGYMLKNVSIMKPLLVGYSSEISSSTKAKRKRTKGDDESEEREGKKTKRVTFALPSSA